MTSHLADLSVPALLDFLARRLPGTRSGPSPSMRANGRAPETAAVGLFVASTATEISQRCWPQGLFASYVDPWDVVAYAAGLSVCYCLDKFRPRLGPAA